MADQAIETLCDLASTALGKYHAPGSRREALVVHSEIMKTIRERTLGKISEAEATKRAGDLRRKLSAIHGKGAT